MQVIATTPGLRLREAGLDDAPFILELLNEPAWRRFIADHEITTEDAARGYIQDRILAMYARHGCGLWVVELAGDATPAGLCGLLKRDTLDDLDLGFAMLAAWQGRGLAFEAARACLDFGFTTLHLPRIAAFTAPDNFRSIRLLEKLGFLPDGSVDGPNGKPSNRFILGRPLLAR